MCEREHRMRLIGAAQRRGGHWLVVGLIAAAALGGGGELALGAEPGQGRIAGQLYISPSGELDTPWVMFGQDVEVVLLRDDGSFDSKLKALREGWAGKIKAQEKVIRDAYSRFRSSKPSERPERASTLRRERVQLDRLAADCRAQIDALIETYRAAATKADEEGRFSFENLMAGRHLLRASFEILRMDQWYHWLLPVEVQEGVPAEVPLKKDNTVGPECSG